VKIKLNKITHEIKPASELTVKEYLQFVRIDGQGRIIMRNFKGYIDYVLTYLSITLNVKFSEILRYKLDNSTIVRILSFIGIIESYEEIKKHELPKSFYFDGKIKQIAKMDIYPVGVRWLMESKIELNNVEHSVYLLSILLLDEFDRDRAESNYNSLLELNYLRVLPLAAFFLRNLQKIMNKEKKFSSLRIVAFITNTLRKLIQS